MTKLPVKLLIVDDEPQIRRFLRASLSAHDYRVIEADTGEEGIRLSTLERPDLVILDLGLPDLDGMDVIKRLREWSTKPIIVLSVRSDETDKIRALDSGADDYVTKPFGAGELIARVRAALRHSLAKPDDTPVFEADGLRIDLAARTVSLHGQLLSLSPKEYDLLKVFVTHAGKVITHRQLLREVWGPAQEGETQYLRVYVGQLRQKIEKDPARPRLIVTEPGVGYRLRETSQPLPTDS